MGAFTEAIRLPSAKFPTIGTVVTGTVEEITQAPVPEFGKDGKVTGDKIGEDGKPVMQVDVVLVDGLEKAVLHTGGSIFYAIGRALANIGADDLELGDTLTVEYTADGEATKGRNAPKQYTATVTKA